MKALRLVLLLTLILLITGCLETPPTDPPDEPSPVMITLSPGPYSAPDAWFSGTVPLQVDINSGTVNGVWFYIDDQLLGNDPIPGKSWYRYPWDTSALKEGIYKFTAIVKTSQGNLQKAINIKIKHYFPAFWVTPSEAKATLYKFEGDTLGYAEGASVLVNGINMLDIGSGLYQTSPGTFQANPGDIIPFHIEHPNMGAVTESIQLPYTAQNFTTSSIDRWLSGDDLELTVTWDAPANYYNYTWDLYVTFYDAGRQVIGMIDDPKISVIKLNDRSRKIANSYIPENTVYVQLKLQSVARRTLGYHILPSSASYSFNIIAETYAMTGNY